MKSLPLRHCASCASITSVLEQAHVAHGLAGAQVVTGALSALVCKRTFGRAMFKLVPICEFGEGRPEFCTQTCIHGQFLAWVK